MNEGKQIAEDSIRLNGGHAAHKQNTEEASRVTLVSQDSS